MVEQELAAPIREEYVCSATRASWPFLLQPPKSVPPVLLLYLHGHGSDERQGMTQGIYNDAFGQLRRECLRRDWAYVCPWTGGNTWMGPAAERGLAHLIHFLRERWPHARVILSGGSMGGTCALIFAMRRRGLIDGVIGLCPAGDIESFFAFASKSENATLQEIAAAIRLHYTAEGRDVDRELRARSVLRHARRLSVPTYLSHGDKDAIIPVDGVRALFSRLQAMKHRVEYKEIADGDHDSPVLNVDWAAAIDSVTAARR